MTTTHEQALNDALLEIKTLRVRLTFLENERDYFSKEVNRLSDELSTSNEMLAAAVNEVSRMDMIHHRNDAALREIKFQAMRAA
jgi:predicted  nucleic acid-binding Zn-ribbon protein